MNLLCISKVSLFFLCILIRLKKESLRGHVACSPSALGGLPVWGLSGRGPLGELPGGALGARPRRTRGGLGSIRGILPAGVLGDRCRVRRLPGQLSLAGLAAHSGASG